MSIYGHMLCVSSCRIRPEFFAYSLQPGSRASVRESSGERDFQLPVGYEECGAEERGGDGPGCPLDTLGRAGMRSAAVLMNIGKKL